MIVIIGDANKHAQEFINRSVNWLKRNTRGPHEVMALTMLPEIKGGGKIEVNPDATEVLYVVGHGSPQDIAGFDVFALAGKLMGAGLTGAKLSSIVLCSCNTGSAHWIEGVNGDFARTLAKFLRVCVRAPIGLVKWVAANDRFNDVDTWIDYTVATPTANQKAEYDSLVGQGKAAEAEALAFTFPSVSFFKGLVDFSPDGRGYIPPLKA